MIEFVLITPGNPYVREIPEEGLLLSRSKPGELVRHLGRWGFDAEELLVRWEKAVKWQEEKGKV